MDIGILAAHVADVVSGWPLIIFVAITSVVCTVAFKFVQFRHFFTGWNCTLFPEKPSTKSAQADMTSLQAFVNTLSVSIGNGSLAGMAVALAVGGPGAAFWVVATGIIMMSVRFAEVYLSAHFASIHKDSKLGGPMLYLRHAIGGKALAYTYAVFCLFFGFAGGNLIQTNSISTAISSTWGVSPIIIAAAVFAFILYIVLGGAPRIVRVSDMIVPVKVSVFFVASAIVIGYNWQGIVPALRLMFDSAFTTTSFAGGLLGFTFTQAIQAGISHSIFATESGLGTAAIFFGATGSDKPVKSALMGMISSFVSTIVCFLVLMSIMASGAWSSGLTSTPLTIAAYETAFGWLAGWLVTFLSITFGMGVLVGYAYVARAAWLVVTNGRYQFVFAILYALVGLVGALVKVQIVWDITNIVNAGMIFINVFGIMCLLPIIIRGLKKLNTAK